MTGLLSTKEAAAKLKISVRRVQALIAAGRLPAEKIGHSFAIRESDLKMVDGRKNGRPINGTKRQEKDWEAVLDKVLGKHDFGPSDLASNKTYLEGLGRG